LQYSLWDAVSRNALDRLGKIEPLVDEARARDRELERDFPTNADGGCMNGEA
jgi:hypothetical protein